MEHEVTPAEITRFTGHADFPATKTQLVNVAEIHHATEDVLSALKELPDREYADENDLVEELEKIS